MKQKNKLLPTIYDLPSTKTGFTLIELLVAIVIMSGISLVATKFLYNMVSYRSKQFAIEDTSASFRNFIAVLGNEVRTADYVDTTATTIIINGTNPSSGSCKLYIYDSVAQIINKASPCDQATSSIMDNNFIKITTFTISPIGDNIQIINLDILGTYKDSLGERDFSYSAAVNKRS